MKVAKIVELVFAVTAEVIGKFVRFWRDDDFYMAHFAQSIILV